MEVKTIYRKINKLGEGPIYDEMKDLIYWVDIEDKKIYASRTFGEEITRIDMPEMVSAVFLTNKEEIIASAGHSLYLIDNGKKIKKLAEVENNINTRFNDGKVSPDGLIIVGTMDLGQKRPIGSLYSFNGKNFKKILEKMTISNGLAWDTKKKVFYIIDSPTKKVTSYEYDRMMNLKYAGVAADLKNEEGVPDGMTIDKEGMLWVAMWGGGKVIRWNPDENKKLIEIKVPAKNTSSCNFGDKDLKTLFITSADSLDDLGGSLFAVKTEYEGTYSFRFDIKNISF
ncbi:MAG: SMP-30/gluconolactonase/LRE family protein [Nitrososphaeria archaeon]